MGVHRAGLPVRTKSSSASKAKTKAWREHLLFAPSVMDQDGYIDLYNSQKSPGEPEYATTSFGNKSLERVVKVIVDLLAALMNADVTVARRTR